MRGLRIALNGAVLLFLLLTESGYAHHQPAMYDLQHLTTVRGTIVSFELINPHCLIHISVKARDQAAQQWLAEAPPPIMLRRVGWDKDKIRAGELITVQGFRAKDGSNLLTVRKIILSNGEELVEHQN